MDSGIDLSKYFSVKRILLPLTLGLLVTLYFLSKDGFYSEELSQISWRKHSLTWLIASIAMMVIRDFAYMWRLRILSEYELSWRQSFEIIILWEFASAISPGAIGGTAAAVVIMAQEKIKTGLTTAIVLVTSFLDELFYILMVPTVILFVGMDSLFPDFQNESFKLIVNTQNLQVLFWGGYTFLLLWTIFLAITLFIKPIIGKRIILAIVSLRPLKKFRRRGVALAQDLAISSIELRNKGMKFWYRAFGATILTWTARFLVVNCLIMIFADVPSQMEVYGRQLVMWVILLISITPGGSGVAEVLFPAFLSKYFPSKQISRMVAILWRIISYYPYIILGVVVLPFWARRVELYSRLRFWGASKKNDDSEK